MKGKTMTTTTLRAATITKLLKANGFRLSEYYGSSNVRGWGNSTKGYEVEGENHTEYSDSYVMRRGRKYWPQTSKPTGRVFITTHRSTNINASNNPDNVAPSLEPVMEFLQSRGFKVEMEPERNHFRLVVTR